MITSQIKYAVSGVRKVGALDGVTAGILPMQNLILESIDLELLPNMIAKSRQKTWEAVAAIRNMIEPGMTEKQAIQNANLYFASQGVKKFWHKTHIRFGTSTVLGFDDPYCENVILKENDILYIDVGPIWDGIEGDCGETFVIGDNIDFLQIKNDVKSLFLETKDFWELNEASGKELYSFVSEKAKKLGYKMQPSYVKGHRLSEFSHQKYSNLGVFDLDFHPSPERWVLELQICHSSMQYGAFYEDLLL